MGDVQPKREAIQTLTEAGAEAPNVVGLPTGVEGFDKLFFLAEATPEGVKRRPLGGLPAYGVYNLTGVPDTGKSLFAEQFALRQAADGRPVAFVTVESPAPFLAAALKLRAQAMGIDYRAAERHILLIDAATHAELREELSTLLATLAYAIREHRIQATVVDSVTGLYEAREIQARQVVRALFNFLKRWRQTGLLVSQKRSGHEELSAEAAGGYAVAHIVDGTIVFSKKLIQSSYDERLYRRPLGELVRLIRIDGCRLAGHDPEVHLLEISEVGLVRVGKSLSQLKG